MKIHEPYPDYAKAGDAFDVRKVPQNKEKPVVLIGNFDEPNLFRAAVVLRGEGWKNVFLFWEGIEYFTGMIWSPPVTSRLVQVIGAQDLAKMMVDPKVNPTIIDVRDEGLFAQGYIPGSYWSEFHEREDIKLRLPGMNGQMLLDYGEYVKVPEGTNPAKPIVFLGRNERHWHAYKAALIARQYGLTNVMWYRGGIGEWAALKMANSNIFRLKQTSYPLPAEFKKGPSK